MSVNPKLIFAPDGKLTVGDQELYSPNGMFLMMETENGGTAICPFPMVDVRYNPDTKEFDANVDHQENELQRMIFRTRFS